MYNDIALYISSGSGTGSAWLQNTWSTQKCDIIHFSTTLQRYYSGAWPLDYPAKVELKVDFYSDTTYYSSTTFELPYIDPDTKEWSRSLNFNRTAQVPANCNKFGFELIFYKGVLPDQIAVDVEDCIYRLLSMEVTGEKAYVELSPSGFLYRYDDEKQIKLGKNSFEIKGTTIEADRLLTSERILIGPSEDNGWNQNEGILNFRQLGNNWNSGIVGSFTGSYYQQFIGINGSMNYNIVSPTTEKYAWYNDKNKIMYWSNNSLYVSSAVFINDKYGGQTNSGEALTFSKTVTAAAGITAIPSITSSVSLSGSIILNGGSARVYHNSNHSGFIYRYEMPSRTLTLQNNSINYIVVSGSGGNPVYECIQNVELIEESQIFPVPTSIS